MRRKTHEAASESRVKTGWGAPVCPEKLSQVKSRERFLQHRQSPMKNLEVKISLFELEFHCKNLFLVWGKRWGARI
jgi:hypothetical protein